MEAGNTINICFHGIGEPRRELEPGEERYWIQRDQFHAMLDELAAWPSVRVSFDDGNLSDVRIGLPGLTARGLSAEFFVLAGRLGTAGSLDEDDVRELQGHGMTIGTHGMHHRSWRGMDKQTTYEEFVAARDRLVEVIQQDIATAACPLGQYDRRALGELRRLGYSAVFTSDRRPARREAWLQPRFSVRRDDTPASLRETVRASHGWPVRIRTEVVGLAKRWR
ncbi:polysaccharide deacetylase family protein [Micromonospora inositola]|uniref:polysaccharide deacetylase family protein n=1 Tax=Micromonospora inositola TaxID=47865 RepID=UPI001E314515|nr:polysaccharide deacetylase family protein [Micromonospora inositola]